MPGRIRTYDLRFRRPLLYPAELLAHNSISIQFYRFTVKSKSKRHKNVTGYPERLVQVQQTNL